MTSSSKRHGSVTPSMQRGEIDAGLEGDKVAGFDPATAPMETDAEAGGTATTPVEPLPRKGVSVKPNLNATSHASAMRPLPSAEAEKPLKKWIVVAILVSVGVVIAVMLGLGLAEYG